MKSLQKHKPIRMKKIRDSARGQDCTVGCPECNYDPATTRLIHYRSHSDNSGEGLKPDDTAAVYACSACDSWLGEGNRGAKDIPRTYEYYDRQWYWFRAMRRTWRLLIEDGVLK